MVNSQCPTTHDSPLTIQGYYLLQISKSVPFSLSVIYDIEVGVYKFVLQECRVCICIPLRVFTQGLVCTGFLGRQVFIHIPAKKLFRRWQNSVIKRKASVN